MLQLNGLSPVWVRSWIADVCQYKSRLLNGEPLTACTLLREGPVAVLALPRPIPSMKQSMLLHGLLRRKSFPANVTFSTFICA